MLLFCLAEIPGPSDVLWSDVVSIAFTWSGYTPCSGDFVFDVTHICFLLLCLYSFWYLLELGVQIYTMLLPTITYGNLFYSLGVEVLGVVVVFYFGVHASVYHVDINISYVCLCVSFTEWNSAVINYRGDYRLLLVFIIYCYSLFRGNFYLLSLHDGAVPLVIQ
jgi:hypothetical protein